MGVAVAVAVSVGGTGLGDGVAVSSGWKEVAEGVALLTTAAAGSCVQPESISRTRIKAGNFLTNGFMRRGFSTPDSGWNESIIKPDSSQDVLDAPPGNGLSFTRSNVLLTLNLYNENPDRRKLGLSVQRTGSSGFTKKVNDGTQ